MAIFGMKTLIAGIAVAFGSMFVLGLVFPLVGIRVFESGQTAMVVAVVPGLLLLFLGVALVVVGNLLTKEVESIQEK